MRLTQIARWTDCIGCDGEVVEMKKVPLGELTTLVSSGSTPLGGAKVYLQDGPVMLIRSQNVLMRELALDDVAFITNEIDNTMKRTKVEKNDVLLNITGASIGRVACFDLEEVSANVNQHVCIVRTNPNLLDHRYLMHFIAQPRFQAQIDSTQHGGTRQALTFEKIRNFQIPLPPITQQKRIAAILDKADAVRRKRQEAIRLTEDLLQSAFLEMFGDPENSHYPVMTLAEACELITDGAHKTPTYVSEGIPFLRVTDIQSENIDWSSTKRIPLEEHRELIKRCFPQKGDVLYSKNGTIGIPRLIDWDEEFSIFVSLALLRPKFNLLLGGYLESFLKTPFALRQARSHTKTGTVSNLHLVEIRKVKLPMPSIEIQKEWLMRKSKIEQQRNRFLETDLKTENLFNSLLQRAFRGEL